MSKMDFSKSHGQIFGGESGRVYEQDGKFFDAGGDECDPKIVAKGEAAAAARAVTDAVEAEKKRKKAARDDETPNYPAAQLAAQLQG